MFLRGAVLPPAEADVVEELHPAARAPGSRSSTRPGQPALQEHRRPLQLLDRQLRKVDVADDDAQVAVDVKGVLQARKSPSNGVRGGRSEDACSVRAPLANGGGNASAAFTHLDAELPHLAHSLGGGLQAEGMTRGIDSGVAR